MTGDPAVDSPTRLTTTVSVQAKRTYFALMAFAVCVLINSVRLDSTRGTTVCVLFLLALLYGGLTVRYTATEITATGLGCRRGPLFDGATWAEITDIAVVDGRAGHVRVITLTGEFKLRVPMYGAPDFEAEVEQIRAAWRAAQDASVPQPLRPADPGD